MSTETSGISFADPQVAACPFAAYRELRPRQPVYHDPKTGLYEVLGAAEIRQAALDPETFTCLMPSRVPTAPGIGEEMARLYREEGFPAMPTLLNNDGEEHRKLRSLVDRAFTPVRVSAIMPAICAEVNQLLGACAGRDEIEFIREFAIPLPLNIIADQLGVSRDDHLAFKAGSDSMLAVSDPLTPPGQMLDYTRAIIRMQHIIARRVEQVRREPDDTILGVVATSDGEDGPLSVGLLVNLFQNILVAGNETTTNALGNGLKLLIDDPGLAERLRGDLGQVRNFVEEALRLHAPLQGFFRSVTRDTELGGVHIPAGSRVMLRWGAGGRDPALFEDPDAVRLERSNATQHMTFGTGAHFCIGNRLARAELKAAFEAIVQRWPNVRLSDRPDAFAPLPAFFAHGPAQMYIR